MQSLAIALSAFSARATRGRRAVLLGYSGLIAVVLLVLSRLISARAAEDGNFIDTLGLADMFAMMLVGVSLFVIAPAMVASQVNEERRSGTLDLLRTAPVTPTALASGFLVGAPATLYLLSAGPIALHVVAGLTGRIPLSALVASLFLIPLGACAAMLIAMLLAVSVGKEGGGAAPLLVAALLTGGLFTSVGMACSADSLSWAFVHPAGALAVLYQSFDGPFRATFSSSWMLEQVTEGRAAAMMLLEPALAIGVYFAGSVLLLSAARRVLAGDVTSRLTKPTALALFGLCAVALIVPARAIVLPSHLEIGHLGAICFALVLPFLACVLGATSTALVVARQKRMSPDGAPHTVAALMILTVFALFASLFGFGRTTEVLFASGREASTFGAFVLVALTIPIYARWAATRLNSNAARLAFWALICTHLSLQIPSIFVVMNERYLTHHDIRMLLSQIDLALGVLLPLFLLRRQALADRKAAALAV